jgi:hypothetical protein
LQAILPGLRFPKWHDSFIALWQMKRAQKLGFDEGLQEQHWAEPGWGQPDWDEPDWAEPD